MSDALTQIVVALNAVANVLGVVLAPISNLPGWLSATVVAIGTGIGLLVIFKYTSNQRAIGRVRRGIRANRLAAKLFNDSAAVALAAQGRMLVGAFQLLLLAIVPIIVMIVPVCLMLGQIALWYQAQPIPVGSEAVVTVKLASSPESAFPAVELEPTPAVEDLSGPVRVFTQREVCWQLRAKVAGYHRLVFYVNGQAFEKVLAVGGGFMRVSIQRPAWDWTDALMHPDEMPFAPESPVQSIEIEYPPRPGWITGTDWWVVYWFGVSLIAGFCLRGVFRVNL
jgi:hypothetical protein